MHSANLAQIRKQKTIFLLTWNVDEQDSLDDISICQVPALSRLDSLVHEPALAADTQWVKHEEGVVSVSVISRASRVLKGNKGIHTSTITTHPEHRQSTGYMRNSCI